MFSDVCDFLFFPVLRGISITLLKQGETFHKSTISNYRRNRLQMFFKIGALKNFVKLTGKHLCVGGSF